jgi:two-component system LytT family sensor kinase
MNSPSKRTFLKVALLAAPLQALVTTTPVFLVLDNDLRVLPVIWFMVSIWIFAMWWINMVLYNKFQGTWKYYFITFVVVMGVSITLRWWVEQNANFIHLLDQAVGINRKPPLLTGSFVALLNNALIIVFQMLLRYRENQINIVKDLAAARISQVEAQYQNLRNQVHPHFLFNSLNTLKVLVKRDPVKAEGYILKLSQFLRTTLQAEKDDLVTVENDLAIGLNYLEIQSIRFDGGFKVDNKLKLDVSNMGHLPILTFQTLFENILKHNKVSEEDPILISIYQNKNGYLVVENSTHSNWINSEDSTGLGLENLRKRFTLKGGEDILIEHTESIFSVKFKALKA